MSLEVVLAVVLLEGFFRPASSRSALSAIVVHVITKSRETYSIFLSPRVHVITNSRETYSFFKKKKSLENE